MNLNSTFILFFIIILSSCVTEKDLILKYKYSEMSLKDDINKTYQSCNTTKKLKINLPDLLYGFYKIKFYENENAELDSSKTSIFYDGKKRLKVTVFNESDTLNEFTIKVKNKGNYLATKRKTFLIPIPFLFFVHRGRKAIIFNDINGNLKVIKGETQTIWVLMAGGNTFIIENEFKSEN